MNSSRVSYVFESYMVRSKGGSCWVFGSDCLRYPLVGGGYGSCSVRYRSAVDLGFRIVSVG